MLQPVRTLVSVAAVALFLWFSFAVKLGPRTLAEHIDRIGETTEAKELVEGTRSTVNPVLEEATSRVLGEHVEAPTVIEAAAGSAIDVDVPARPLPTTEQPSTGDRSRVPGRPRK